MPMMPMKPCSTPGCGVLVAGGRCQACRAKAFKGYARRRRETDAEVDFYKSPAWRAVRAAYLRVHPLCEGHQAEGRVVASSVVDHRKPIKDGGARFDWDNLCALCPPCHNAKTLSETRARGALAG